ncbi:hypothetical protein IGI04_023259 [Brassica rapa subsp. trilocularis]|uniref:Uncharacterized protein n=1 Tax=Brassica rapa subsp. trilocularis TaxID=1813537 RepID=A0ABQ7M5P5_BRACM|nr:hypothetical protein IGI04_023259 [Brassica rapa subsp. trilocularis]
MFTTPDLDSVFIRVGFRSPSLRVFFSSLAFLSISVVGVKNGYDKFNIQNILPYEKALRKRESRRPTKARNRSLRSDRTSVPLGRYVATELGKARLLHSVATERSSRSVATDRARAKARSLRSDRALVLLGRYVATELGQAPARSLLVPLGRYVATERARPATRLRSLRSDRALVPLGRYGAIGLEPKFGRCVAIELFRTSTDINPCILVKPSNAISRRPYRSKRVESEDGPKGPKTRLEAHPTISQLKARKPQHGLRLAHKEG